MSLKRFGKEKVITGFELQVNIVLISRDAAVKLPLPNASCMYATRSAAAQSLNDKT